MKRATIFFVLAILAACGKQASSPPPAAPPQSPPVRDASPSEAAGEAVKALPAAQAITATLHVVDLEGKPLAGMIPIATAQANAFDAPVVQGAPTDGQGAGRLELPAGKWLFVRAWDPEQRWFANSYFEVPPGEGTSTREMEIVMAAAASIEATLLNADGLPAANENVGLMLLHPTQGPWWPGEADTDPEGRVHFAAVPPGRFVIKMKAIHSGQVEVPETLLAPGGRVKLGEVRLQ